MALNANLVTVGSIDGGETPIQADVTTLGSDVPVVVTLTTAYAQLCPPGWPARPGEAGAAAAGLNYPKTLLSGTTMAFLACEAAALVEAGAATYG